MEKRKIKKDNPALAALRRAVNRAVAEGSPTFVNMPVEPAAPQQGEGLRERCSLGVTEK